MKLLNFGSCNIDIVYSLDHIVRDGETEKAYRVEQFAGGKGLNQSIAAARAGAEVYHAGCVGFDGNMLLEMLRDNGVDISFVGRTDERNGHAMIQVAASGENSIIVYPGSNSMITEAYVDSVLDSFGEGDIVLLQNEIGCVKYIIGSAHKKKCTVIFNPSPMTDDLRAVDYGEVSYLILNEVELKSIAKCDSLHEAIERLRESYPRLKLLLTLGENGSIYIDSTRSLYQSAFSVETVDTTAAGDTFTGYFVSGLASGDDIAKTLMEASAAAAIAVSRRGAAPSVPRRDEVMSALMSLRKRPCDDKFGGAVKAQLLGKQCLYKDKKVCYNTKT